MFSDTIPLKTQQPPPYRPPPTPPPSPPNAMTTRSFALSCGPPRPLPNALAQAAPQDTVPTHRRGGRPPPTRRKPRAWPRRTQRPAGPGNPAPTATGINAAKLPKLPRWTPGQHPTTASSPPTRRDRHRDGHKARQQTGASESTASSDCAASSTVTVTTSATRNVMRLNGRD